MKLITLAGVLAMSGFFRSQEISAPPKSEEVFAEWQALTDTASAQRLFRPISETKPVERVASGGYVRLPVNFAGTHHERVGWDIGIKRDFRKSRGVQFDFYCSDPSPVYSFKVYFRSGEGWYQATFRPEKAGVWQRIVIDKTDVRPEGKVAGWGAVDVLRLACWRGADQDTLCALANLGPAGGKPDVLVLSAESNSLKGGDTAKSCAEYAGAVSSTLDRLGVASLQVADLELTPELLTGVRLVVLPFNPAVPPEALLCLKNFVAGGGKLMVCYSLPKEVGALLGLSATNSLAMEDNVFAGFARTAEGLKMQPAFAPQASWRTTVAAARAGTAARVIAVWRNGQGADTQVPAITLVPHGAFFGHIWMRSSAEANDALMRAVVGELVPEVWRQTSERSLARIGMIGGASEFSELRHELLSLDDAPTTVRQALKEAVKARAEAKRLHKQGRWGESVEMSGRATAAAAQAWFLSLKPRPGEHRAFWCHSAFGLNGKDWDASIRLMKENGFNAILPNMLWGGLAFYPSKVLPEYGQLAEKGDQIAQCLAACKKYGVKCHVWKVCWNTGGRAPKTFLAQIKAEGRVQKNYNGEEKAEWLCPSNPTNQLLEVEAMLEVVRNYEVDGVHFDYIRYPGKDFCFCDGCRRRFEAVLGRAVEQWPADTRKQKDVSEKWLDFRRSNINTVVYRVAEGARKIRPGVKISAAVFRNLPLDRDGVGQDWKLWCEQGWLDFVCPMDYFDSNLQLRDMVVAQKAYAGRVPLYPGLGLHSWKVPADPVKTAEQIMLLRALDVPGFTVFNYDANAEAVLPFLRLGVTSD